MRRPFVVLMLLGLTLSLVPATTAQAESSAVRSFSLLSVAGTTINLTNHESIRLEGDTSVRLATVSQPGDPCRLQVAFRHVTAVGAVSGDSYQITGVDHFLPQDPCRDLGTLVRTTTVFQLVPPALAIPGNPVVPGNPIRLSVTYTAVPNEATGDPVLTNVVVEEPVT